MSLLLRRSLALLFILTAHSLTAAAPIYPKANVSGDGVILVGDGTNSFTLSKAEVLGNRETYPIAPLQFIA
ncbi:hypothetical protein K474DRAFT_1663094 [Panus rudis PR-1116 ss-1]|nr:hypothetical protein K474DRAFT_1663094 [Panus rudis PR-1116 ss-1]